MKSVFVENGGGTQRIYDSMLVEPADLSIFSNGLAMKIIAELGKKPLCAMDLAKKLGQHEQKVYYHLRKMKDAGIVRLERSESRYGMTAKIYALVSPVIVTKLYDGGYQTTPSTEVQNPEIKEALEPFVLNGKLNAKIVIGAPIPHGSYGATARDGVHIIDLALFIGKFLNGNSMNSYKLDVEVNEKDLKGNLILIGGPKINAVVNRINKELPIHFDAENEWTIMSKLTGNNYNYDDDAVIIKLKNPFNKKNEILLLAGRHSRGLRSAIIAFTQHMEEIWKGNIENDKMIAKVVRGLDKDSDGIVDSVIFME